MGYSSDLAVYFYVVDSKDAEGSNRAKAMLKLWWSAVKSDPMFVDNFSNPDYYEETDSSILFRINDVKWYDEYPDVQWFTKMSNKYIKNFCENEELDGGSGLHNFFCYEFVRLGQNYEDIAFDYRGYGCESRLSVYRSIEVN